MAIDRPTHLADFPAPLADAVAQVLRERGLPASVDRQGDLGVVVVPAERRDEAVDVMAAQMDEIHERAHGPAAAVPGSKEAAEELAAQQEPSSRPLVSERLGPLGELLVIQLPIGLDRTHHMPTLAAAEFEQAVGRIPTVKEHVDLETRGQQPL
jgi:hypothetical protein